MPKDTKISVSILCADFLNLEESIKMCENAGVDMFHIDVMDGHFVPNITIGPLIVKAIRPLTKLPIDAHLMIENPGAYIDDFIDAGVDIISVHAECYGERRASCRGTFDFPKEVDSIDAPLIKKDISKIKSRDKKVFVVFNPGTPLCVQPILSDIDGVLIMSVNPGFAKQKFMASVLPKLQELRKTYTGNIAIDGGINETTAPEAIKAGANILATASYFFNSNNPKKDVVQYIKDL